MCIYGIFGTDKIGTKSDALRFTQERIAEINFVVAVLI
jgi:hypothetical protein